MSYIRPFDPWRGKSLCTCPFKYTVNPYTGCQHRCLYCYASSYIKDFFNPRPKANFLEIARKDISKIPRGAIINISSSSDPYQPLESKYQYTRRLLELVSDNYVIEIVTKSDLVTRDIDILSKARSVVSITITTLDETLARRLEPGAPSPSRRIDAIKKLTEAGVPVVLRYDPIIPGLNDSKESISAVLEAAVTAGARHVVSSTYKIKPDNLARMLSAFPDLEAKFEHIYRDKKNRIQGYIYADKEYRYRTLSTVRDIAHSLGVTFATCREGLYQLNDKGVTCDGTSLATRNS